MGDIKILSLDGGGSWAILQAKALKALYGGDTEGHRLLEKFDLAVANSGGSLVLAGLLLNWSPNQIIELFGSELVRKDIFVGNRIHHPLGNRYKAAEKKVGLAAHFVGKNGFDCFGTARLATIVDEMHHRQHAGRLTEVVITGYDYDEDRAIFFKSSDGSGSSPAGRQMPRRRGLSIRRNDASLVDACHVASNAPVVYFDDPAHAIVDDRPLRGWDGAIGGYNNPLLAGITEALTLFRCKPENLKCLSLGTANSWQPLRSRSSGSGDQRLFKKELGDSWATELVKLAKAITGEPPASATYVAAFMLGHTPPFDMGDFRLIRMNPMIQPVFDETRGQWRCPLWARDSNGQDEPERFEELVELDMDAVDQDEVDRIIALGDAWLADEADNQLIVSSGDTRRRRGFPTFSAARAAWEAL